METYCLVGGTGEIEADGVAGVAEVLAGIGVGSTNVCDSSLSRTVQSILIYDK